MFPSDACSVYTMTTTQGNKNQLSQTDPRDALRLAHRVLYNVNVQRWTGYTLHGQGRRRRTSTIASTVNLVRLTTVSQSILQSSSGYFPYFGETLITYKMEEGGWKEVSTLKTSSIRTSVSTEHRLHSDRHSQ